MAHRRVDRARIGEPDLGLLWVDVDVDRAVRQIDQHDRDGVAAARHELAVAHRERVEDAAIADRPAPDEELDAPRGGLRELGGPEEALHARAALFPRRRDHARRDTRTEQRLRAREAIAIRRCLEGGPAVVAEPQVELGVRHRDPRDQLGDVRGLGRLGLLELLPRGHVPQQVSDLDRGAHRRADLADLEQAATFARDPRRREVCRAPGRECEA